jgi:hypothetical protein
MTGHTPRRQNIYYIHLSITRPPVRRYGEQEQFTKGLLPAILKRRNL